MKESIEIDGESVEIEVFGGAPNVPYTIYAFPKFSGVESRFQYDKETAVELFIHKYRQHKLAKLREQIADAAVKYEIRGNDIIARLVAQYKTLKQKIEESME